MTVDRRSFVRAGSAAFVIGTFVLAGSAVGGCDEDIEATRVGDAAPATDSATPPPPGDATTNTDASVCAPRDITGFTPTWKPPIAFHQKKCSPTQVATLASCVWTHPGRDEAACKTFFDSPANADCIACGYTKTDGANLGAIVSNDTSVEANYAGCIAIATNDLTANGCGAKVQASLLCQDHACVDACPVPAGDDAAFTRFTQCLSNAAAGVCKSYTDPATCQNATYTDGGASICAPVVADFGERAEYYVDLFCGGTADGGPG